MPTATKEDRSNGDPPEVTLTAAGDPSPPVATPLILNDAYFELGGVNLRCLVKHLEATFAENKPVTVTTLCGETDYPGITKYHLRVTFHQTFDTGAVYATLNAALQAYAANNTPVNFKARPHSSQVASATNPIISGYVIPQPFDLIVGDAGTAAEVAIDWNLTGPPTVDNGSVAATGAQAGSPGYFTPSGASVPANLAALTGISAVPATAWATGQYVITADLLANHWSGSAWVAGKA
ncbi:MAG TPA: hypothetical protein VGH66_12500 [Acidimicrobiales bacterium]|jgi:hypothetical protein